MPRRWMAMDGMHYHSGRLEPCPPTALGAEPIGQAVLAAALVVNAELHVHDDTIP